ncbi:MAG: polyphosphate kinase 2 family protein [Phycisphaeraceae bacterium]|nr:MAG: polyphosphate kinase 2 family protein [Phycisphaeraceae bacterium]
MIDTSKTLAPPGHHITLSAHNPSDALGVADRQQAELDMRESVVRIAELQHRLWAEGRRSLLVVLQAMDTGGKDGVIRHVFSGMNPMGMRVVAFGIPTELELSHDFLWRIHKEVPPRGKIGVFNRSHYEDVVIARVHNLVPEDVWRRRYAEIREFERHLTDNGVVILKLFLHISKEEQLKRLKSRLTDPKKNWKLSPDDFRDRKHWKDYQLAYEDAITECGVPCAPWRIIPADRKWLRNVVVAQIVRETLEAMDPQIPPAKFDFTTIEVE